MKKYPYHTQDFEKDGKKYTEKDIRAYLPNRTAQVVYRGLLTDSLIESFHVVTKTSLIKLLQKGFHVRQFGSKSLKTLEEFTGLKLEIYMDQGRHFLRAAELNEEPGAAVFDTDLETILIRHPSGKKSQAYLYKPERLILFGGMTEDLFHELGYEYAEGNPAEILERARNKANDK